MDDVFASGDMLRVTFLIATHNRREVLLHTLERIGGCGLGTREFEVIVIDNASTDQTAEAVRRRFPGVTLLRQPANRGPCAKNAGLSMARGQFFVFLDDDSSPEPGSIRRMIGYFDADPGLAAAVFTITLPDGSRECSAYPNVCIGCGTGFRRCALMDVGGLPDDFFMGAEEYDLSLRLLDAGWRVRLFADLHVAHLKSPLARFPRKIARLDACNNTLLALRYFPEPWRMRYALEWLERYRLMGIVNGCRSAFWSGAIAGMARGLATEPRPLGAAAFEQFSRLEQTFRGMNGVRERFGARRILLIDLGKNMLAYRWAAQRCGLEIAGVADARLGGRGLRYRGMQILSDDEAAQCSFDAAVISNLSPVHAAQRLKQWRKLEPRRPVIDLFETAPSAGRAVLAA
jgi:GT2 family glycosyltransferase